MLISLTNAQLNKRFFVLANQEIDLPDSMYDKLSLAEKQVPHSNFRFHPSLY